MELNVLEYNGYFTKIHYSSNDNVLHGKIEGINDLVTFESGSCDTIEEEFHAAVDDYLEFCKEVGKEPDKTYKGSFNIRIPPELHKRADYLAKKQGKTLNQLVSDAISSYLDGPENKTIIYCTIPIQKWGLNNPPVERFSSVTQQFDFCEVYQKCS